MQFIQSINGIPQGATRHGGKAAQEHRVGPVQGLAPGGYCDDPGVK